MHQDLIMVAELVEVLGPDTLTVAGMPVEGAVPPQSDQPLTAALAASLYQHCYLRPSGPAGRFADPVADREFQRSLARSNAGQGSWDSGWLLEATTADGELIVAWHGVRFRAGPDQVRLDPETTACQVRVPAGYLHLHPGFYLMAGEAGSGVPDPADAAAVRLYWHLTSRAAPRWLAEVSRRLNAAGVPFRAKVLSSPEAYRRADAGVLYLARRDFPGARGLVAQVYAEVGHELRDAVPLFTKRLAAGLSVAEDPPGQESFGQHRCALVAQALLDRTGQGGPPADRQAKRAAIEAAFRRAGLDPQAPYLGPGSPEIDDLRLVPGPGRSDGRRRSRRTGDGRGNRAGALLAAAVDVGEALCAATYWDRGGKRCNWIGRSNREASSILGMIAPSADALGWDLYSGLGGVALFLAELFGQVPRPAFRRTALGAIRCALGQLERGPAPDRSEALGFYTGLTGTLYAAWRVAQCTGEDIPAGQLVDRILAAAAAGDSSEPADFLGRGGAVPALLLLGREPGWSRCREVAIALADDLRNAPVVALDPPAARGQDDPPLTGLSHGAAGIGLALLELHAETGNDGFLDAGRRAFRYEDALFDPGQGNWPDLRPAPGREEPVPGPRFMVAWCHGAPGIALSRLRASRLDPSRSDRYREHARAAIETTRRHLGQRSPASGVDATLCHGTAGLIEAVWTGGLALDEPSWRHAALEATTALAQVRTAGGWQSGVLGGGPNPSLMLGDAGVGYQLLRLHDPRAVPSLLLGPDGFHPAATSSGPNAGR
jgi:hypothetical protein